MYKRLTALLTVVLCMALVVAWSMTAMATEPDGSSSQQGSVTSSQTSQTDTDFNSSETQSTDSSDSSDASSGDEVSSEDGTSSENGNESSSEVTSGDETSSVDGTSSSDTTTSKPNKPIYSDGGGGGSTFIEQDPSQLASLNASTVVNSVASDEPISSEYIETDEEIDEYYQTKTSLVADGLVKYIWIPITVAVLCIAALITVNILFRKKYPKKAKNGASRRSGSSASKRPKRRK